MKLRYSWVVLAALSAAYAFDGPVRIEFDTVVPEVVQQRLKLVPHKPAERRPTLESLFREAGCDGDRLTEEPVRHVKEPNVVCTLPSEGPGVIVVGAHFDFAERGIGAVDDWSGAALLPDLYQSLKSKPRRHRFVFVGFTAEERGLAGSTDYVKHLSGPEKSDIRAMVNLECLGLSRPKVWASRADKDLLEAYFRVAGSIHQEAAGVNVERVGDDDSHPFLQARIPVLTIHSVTQQTLPILHSGRDNLNAIDADDYYAAYKLTAAYLAYLDLVLP